MAHQATAILDTMVGPLWFGGPRRPEHHFIANGKAHSYGCGSCIGWFESAHYDTLTEMNIANKAHWVEDHLVENPRTLVPFRRFIAIAPD